MKEIKIGDVVHLKSDLEHKFTVCEVSDGTIKVLFFNTVTQSFSFTDRGLDKRFFILCKE